MNDYSRIRLSPALHPACWRIVPLCLALAGLAHGWAQEPHPSPAAATTVVLDRVVAVVNNQAILRSDVDLEIRLSVLDPSQVGQGVLTPPQALDHLISRALILQQMRQEGAQAAEPSQDEVSARVADLRKELPACVRQNCATDSGWKTFLAAHGLELGRVEIYMRYRLQILGFIERRFRQGIRISPQEIETYYHGTLVPQYAAGEPVPTLEKVSPRIEEILLQEQVNVMFDEWLKNLRQQGDIEVLDPALEGPETRSGGEGSE